MTNWPTMSGPDGSSAQHASAHHGAGSPRDRTGAAPERPWIGDCDKACDLIRRTAPAGALRSWPRVCRLSSGRGHQGYSVYATRGPGTERGRAGANRFIRPPDLCFETQLPRRHRGSRFTITSTRCGARAARARKFDGEFTPNGRSERRGARPRGGQPAPNPGASRCEV